MNLHALEYIGINVAKINPPVLNTDDCRDAGVTTPRMGEVDRSRKPEPRPKQEARVENTENIRNLTFAPLVFSVV